MAGLDFPRHFHMHVCEARDLKSMTMGQSPEPPEGDRRRAWSKKADKSSTENPNQTNVPLSAMSTGTKIATQEKSATDPKCTPKTATTFWSTMQPAKRVDPLWVHPFCGLHRGPEKGPCLGALPMNKNGQECFTQVGQSEKMHIMENNCISWTREISNRPQDAQISNWRVPESQVTCGACNRIFNWYDLRLRQVTPVPHQHYKKDMCDRLHPQGGRLLCSPPHAEAWLHTYPNSLTEHEDFES